jgi:predicted DNA binding CopG/RHH family protein
MPLKNKIKVYLSLAPHLLNHVQERSAELGINRATYISNLLKKDYDLYQKEKINNIIEGKKNNYKSNEFNKKDI